MPKPGPYGNHHSKDDSTDDESQEQSTEKEGGTHPHEDQTGSVKEQIPDRRGYNEPPRPAD